VRVSAAPTDGSANAAVIALIAKAIGRPRSAVRIAAGETARVKRLELDATDAEVFHAFGNPPAHQKL